MFDGSSAGGPGERPGTGQQQPETDSGQGKVLPAPPPGRAGQALHTYFASEKKSGGILLRLFVGAGALRRSIGSLPGWQAAGSLRPSRNFDARNPRFLVDTTDLPAAGGRGGDCQCFSVSCSSSGALASSSSD